MKGKPLTQKERKQLEELLSGNHVIPKTIRLKRGEVKELSEGVFIKKTREGVLKIYVTEGVVE